MATEEGIVVRSHTRKPEFAWVKTVPSSACESCSARHSCNPGSNANEREVEAINLVGAQPGDRIVLSMATGALLKATFLVYVFPIICMLIGGVIGHTTANGLNLNASVISVVTAIIGLVIGFIVAKQCGVRMAEQRNYRPQIIRIVTRNSHNDPLSSGNAAT